MTTPSQALQLARSFNALLALPDNYAEVARDAVAAAMIGPAGTAFVANDGADTITLTINDASALLSALGGGTKGKALFAASTDSAARTLLALGTAALMNGGTGANQLLQLGSDSLVPTSVLPEALLGAMAFKGFWNASTNTTTPTSGSPGALPTAAAGNLGNFYIVNTAGSSSQGGVTDWKVGDWAVSLGANGWAKIDSSDQVTAVAGLVGNISASDLWTAILAVVTPASLKPLENTILALSDVTTALTTGTLKAGFPVPYNCTYTAVFAALIGAQSSSGAVTANAKKNGSTMFTTQPAIGASQSNSLSGSGSVAAVLTSTPLAASKGDAITGDIVAAGTGAKGLLLVFEYYRT